jgi:hypothetical protein
MGGKMKRREETILLEDEIKEDRQAAMEYLNSGKRGT